MSIQIINKTKTSIILQIEIPLNGSLLEREERIQAILQQAGASADIAALEVDDTDGKPLVINGVRYTSKGMQPKEYQTPHGGVFLNRHVYQSSLGGATYCPMEDKGRIIIASTPMFARQASSLYGLLPVREVISILNKFGRNAPSQMIQKIGEAVGAGALAAEKQWQYEAPVVVGGEVRSVAVSLDGTTIRMDGEGYRIAMVGSVSLFDPKGERLHTIYLAAAPEHGKASFLERFRNEVLRTREQHPRAIFIGLADGAPDNWSFLAPLTDIQTLDYWHAAEYLTPCAEAVSPGDLKGQKAWCEKQRAILKEQLLGPSLVLEELQRLESEPHLTARVTESLHKAKTYYTNQKSRMNYASNIALDLPIGSGVIEAACKSIVNHRLGVSGARWKDSGAKSVLALSALIKSDTRWDQFWAKININGLPVPAPETKE